MSKLRIDGETIEPKMMYSGRRLIELANISYENGRKKAESEIANTLQEKYMEGYKSGYASGYREASKDLAQLRKLLSKILKG